MSIVIVERSFAQPTSEGDIETMFARLGPCLKPHGARWIHSYVSENGARMFCAFEAADAESVRLAHRLAGIDFERVWPARRLHGD